MRDRFILAVGLFAGCLAASVATAAGTPAQKCEAGKNQVAGKYASCVQAVQKAFVLSADAAKRAEGLTKCETKRSPAWDALESNAVEAGSHCPSEVDSSYVRGFLDECSDGVATALAGGGLPVDPITCNSTLGSCEDQLASCELHARPLKTSLAACYDTDSYASIPCAGTGQDGELQLGVARAFTDNGDGTITDTATGLVWEKLSRDGGIHDIENYYTWTEAPTVKVATLNSTVFAGHSDWRVPNYRELLTLRNLGAYNPAVYGPFETACSPGCTVNDCSCSGYSYDRTFWSSTTWPGGTDRGFTVDFAEGLTGVTPKIHHYNVRAVRGGA